MENLLQIKDLFPAKTKAENCDSKADSWLKSHSSEENKFKDFSQALNNKEQSQGCSPCKQKEDKGAPLEKSNIPLNPTANTVKQSEHLSEEDEKEINKISFLQDNPEEPLETSLDLEAKVSLEGLNFLYDEDSEKRPVEEKISLEPILQKVVEEDQMFSIKEASYKAEEGEILENQPEKKDLTDAIVVPLLAENLQILPEIKPEKISQEVEYSTVNNEVVAEELDSVHDDSQKLPQPKLNSEKVSTKAPLKAVKDSILKDNVPFVQKSSDFLDKVVLPRNLDFSRNVGINSALSDDKIKVGIVSTKQINSFYTENAPKQQVRVNNISQNLDTVVHENLENRISSSRHTFDFKQDESTTAPKVILQKYDEVRQNYTDNVNGVIAAIAEQMDEIKRVRRNSLNVKIDLENGESLNCQLVLSNENLNVRFPSIEDSFKTQILNHWEQLRQFAEKRNFNLANPYFANHLSL